MTAAFEFQCLRIGSDVRSRVDQTRCLVRAAEAASTMFFPCCVSFSAERTSQSSGRRKVLIPSTSVEVICTVRTVCYSEYTVCTLERLLQTLHVVQVGLDDLDTKGRKFFRKTLYINRIDNYIYIVLPLALGESTFLVRARTRNEWSGSFRRYWTTLFPWAPVAPRTAMRGFSEEEEDMVVLVRDADEDDLIFLSLAFYVLRRSVKA